VISCKIEPVESGDAEHNVGDPAQEGTMSARTTSAKKNTQRSARSTTATGKASGKAPTGFTAEERAAMKERAKELKAERRFRHVAAARDSWLVQRV
jgi:hypothetical protein